MRVVILGAGVIGVTTAYRLLKDGHEVTLLDRGEEAANFTSYANAGLMAPGHAYAWSSPRAPGILLRSLWRGDQALRFKPSLDPALWRWTFRFLGQCTAERARINTVRKVKLCLYSQAAFKEVVAETGIAYDGRGGGLLYLYRNPANFEAAVAKMSILADNGAELQVLDPAAAARLDPALAGAVDKLAGALFAPGDESGDARIFTLALAERCRALGADFRFRTEVLGLEAEGGRIARVATGKDAVSGDAYVVALGVYSPQLLKPLGIELPIYPIKGYSVTLPVAGRNGAPAIGGVDEDNLVAYAPLGDRLRITATAEFAGYGTAHRPADFQHMLAAARDLFPEGGDYARPNYWAGLRPMTPEGTPILGRTPYGNLFVNSGHGHMGWTMACGSARILADLLSGRRPEIDLEGLTLH